MNTKPFHNSINVEELKLPVQSVKGNFGNCYCKVASTMKRLVQEGSPG